MPFVIDASVTMAWCFEDESSAATDQVLDRLRSDPAFVPSLWQLEVANVLVVAERRRRLTPAQSARFIGLLSQLPIRVEIANHDIAALTGTARQHGLSAYDSAYLVLAERSGLELATTDERLRNAARAAGVALIV